MKPWTCIRWLALLLASGAAAFSADTVRGDVVVIVNRTRQAVEFTAHTTIAPPQAFALAPGQLVPISMRAAMHLTCPSAYPVHQPLAANSAYYFQITDEGILSLQEIDLRSDTSTRSGRELGNPAGWEEVITIPVKILVDDEEPAVRQNWETRLRNRLEAASILLSELFRVRFEVIGTDTWTSDNDLTRFEDSLREFVRKVDPRPARLAIGFTGQYPLMKEKHLGGVPSPLHTHILVREWGPRITEAERVEVLVHELGHFLGACHSPEGGSVMRPILGDGLARWGDFRIAFDPVNALAICLVAEELRHRQISSFAQLSPGTAIRLRQLYRVLNQVQPDDPASGYYLELLKKIPNLPPDPAEPSATEDPWPIAATREVLQQIVAAAQANAGQTRPQSGDELTAHYVRKAAGAAESLQPQLAPRAFVLALGIGLDHSEMLRNNPLLAEFFQAVESPSERSERLRVLGAPTVHGRRDLAQHFAVSAFLTASHGSQLAEAAGFAKEILDARGASGFSFPDLAADYAGIAFASAVLAGAPPLADLATAFAVPRFVPPVADLPEGLSWQEFARRYGSFSDPRYQRLRGQILERLHSLPGYQPSPAMD